MLTPSLCCNPALLQEPVASQDGVLPAELLPVSPGGNGMGEEPSPAALGGSSC